MSHLAIGLFAGMAFLGSGPSARDGRPSGPWWYLLSRGGYSSVTGQLLISVARHPSAVRGVDAIDAYAQYGSFLVIHGQGEGSARCLYSVGNPMDFAWIPGQPAFVVTSWRDGMVLFRKDTSAEGYGGTSLSCPADVSYEECAWNPAGQTLAVGCTDYRQSGRAIYRLGFYSLKEDKFTLTDLDIRAGSPLFWRDDKTLCLVRDYGLIEAAIIEVTMESEGPGETRTVLTGEGVRLIAVLDDQVLAFTEKGLKFGTKMLIEARELENWDAIATESAIFVSASSKHFVVFDVKGREIARTNPGKDIVLGSVGEDPNTVYGMAGNTIVRLHVKDGTLSIQPVYDLTRDLSPASEMRNKNKAGGETTQMDGP